jgi:hypothetical protein
MASASPTLSRLDAPGRSGPGLTPFDLAAAPETGLRRPKISSPGTCMARRGR